MAMVIRPKRKFTAGAPGTGDLVEGEIAINTADKKLYVRDNANTIIEIGGGGSGGSTTEVTQSNHGLAVKDGIRHNGTAWVKAVASGGTTLALGVVVAVANSNTFTVAQSGRFELTSHGLTVGQWYYLDATTAGALTATEPGISQPLVYVESSSHVFVYPYRPTQILTSTTPLGIFVDEFTGDGSDTTFTMGGDPIAETNTQVYLNGVYQEKATYSVSGTTLTFSTAPANSTSVEVVRYAASAVTVGTPDDNTVTTAKIADGAITAAKFAAGAISNASIPDNSITTAKLVNGTIITVDLADDAVTTAKIADAQITTALIADDAVTTDKLANSINSAITANTAKVTNAITTHTGDVTGGAALTIAVDAVDIPMLSATGSPSSATFLRGDNAWAEVPAGIDIQSSAPSVASEGSLYYNSTIDTLHLSNGTSWMPIDTNTAPTATGGTVTLATQGAFSTYTYNLGLNFSDPNSTDAQLVYSLESGTLPPGAVLPTSGNTALTGTATNPGSATTYNFVIRATDPKAAFASQAYTQTITAGSTGGTVTTPTGFRVHTFTSSGTFNPGGMGTAGTISMAIVAGGGAGGGARHGAGGGGGGMVVLTSQTLAEGNFTVTIGAGGHNTGIGSWGSGSNTVAFGQTAIGGGRSGAQNGSTWRISPLGGGSGGGGVLDGASGVGGAGTSGQGHAGGNGNNANSAIGGGAGGGAGAVGGNGSSSSGGVGGAGADFNGVTYAGGGGGPGWNGSYGAGGSGGGGSANSSSYSTSGPVGGAGATNKGGGGGGANSISNNARGGTGGSGVVIIKVPV